MEGQIIWLDCAEVIEDKDWIWEIRAKHQDLFAKVDSDDSNDSDNSHDSHDSHDSDGNDESDDNDNK